MKTTSTNQDFSIQKIKMEDQVALCQLYKEVAKRSGGIVRNAFEINEVYVNGFLQKTIETGLGFCTHHLDQIVGEIHAYKDDIYAHRHVLGELTIIVHPDFQGKGLGKQLFTHFLKTVQTTWKDILRVELFVREQRTRTVQFYTKLGFKLEGRFPNKVYNADGTFETPLQMCWINPSFIAEIS